MGIMTRVGGSLAWREVDEMRRAAAVILTGESFMIVLCDHREFSGARTVHSECLVKTCLKMVMFWVAV